MQNVDINEVILAVIAIMNALTAFLAYRTHVNMAGVVAATDGMKDALVKATGQASHAAGVTEGLAQGAADKALFEAGAKSAMENNK